MRPRARMFLAMLAAFRIWNTNRRLRMDFVFPASSVAIDFIGGDLFTNDVARLDIFNGAGTLLDSYTSRPRATDNVETMTLTRPAGDIAWAVAYLPPGGGSFGRFDNLRFTVVPEPVSGSLLAFAAVLWQRRRIWTFAIGRASTT